MFEMFAGRPACHVGGEPVKKDCKRRKLTKGRGGYHPVATAATVPYRLETLVKQT